MRLHRFFIDKEIGEEKLAVCDERLIHQWRNVFRYNVGSEVVVFDGRGFEFDTVIESLNNREAVLSIVSKKEGILPRNKIILYQSLIKKDKMEWVVEKATELGVSKIVPIVSERSEKKGFNVDRAKKIAIEAAEQCGRCDVPAIESIQELLGSIQGLEGEIIIFDKSGTPLDASLKSNDYEPISIFIGPEGGWTPKELELFSAIGGSASGGKQKGAQVYSLGPLTLRAETAATVALARLLTLD